MARGFVQIIGDCEILFRTRWMKYRFIIQIVCNLRRSCQPGKKLQMEPQFHFYWVEYNWKKQLIRKTMQKRFVQKCIKFKQGRVIDRQNELNGRNKNFKRAKVFENTFENKNFISNNFSILLFPLLVITSRSWHRESHSRATNSRETTYVNLILD